MGIIIILPIIPAVGMFTISFFVLLGASKTDSRGLKELGRLIAIVLWITSIYLIAFAIYTNFTDKPYGTKRIINQYMGGWTAPYK
jgi:hypothetical protein